MGSEVHVPEGGNEDDAAGLVVEVYGVVLIETDKGVVVPVEGSVVQTPPVKAFRTVA